MSGEKLLVGAGTVSHEQAMDKVKSEYKKYQARTLSEVEQVYLDCISKLTKKRKTIKNRTALKYST